MTMQKTLITIGRQFGSGGGYVAKAVARMLDIPFYDNELISKAAEESGFSRELFRERDERASLFSMSTFFESWRFGQPQNYMNDNTLFSIQSKVIREIADKGPAVIIGRCADYILRDLETLDVFVTAPLEFRIRRVMEREKMERQEAENLIRRKDRTRETYYNYFTFGSWGTAANYDLCIDSSILDIEGTAAAIIDFGRRAGRIAHA